ncbi:MAG: class I SAM-dependent methyltransferase, partial [Treponema sp.]|nr:class I SAM-dependent methyltransferase [Treponema sp.]
MENAKKLFKKILKVIESVIPIQFKRLIWKNRFHKKILFPYKNDPNVFTIIYNNNLWGSEESRSGEGSCVNTTKIIRKMLPVLWKEYDIKTFLDVPCGDYNWMKEVKKDNIIYIGGDIVNELIEQNNQKYKTGNVSFRVLDITKDVLPTVDMIFCKDCLQHLSYEDV